MKRNYLPFRKGLAGMWLLPVLASAPAWAMLKNPLPKGAVARAGAGAGAPSESSSFTGAGEPKNAPLAAQQQLDALLQVAALDPDFRRHSVGYLGSLFAELRVGTAEVDWEAVAEAEEEPGIHDRFFECVGAIEAAARVELDAWAAEWAAEGRTPKGLAALRKAVDNKDYEAWTEDFLKGCIEAGWSARAAASASPSAGSAQS